MSVRRPQIFLYWKPSLGILNLGFLLVWWIEEAGDLGLLCLISLVLVFCLFFKSFFFTEIFGLFFFWVFFKLEVFGLLEVDFCKTCLGIIFCLSSVFLGLGRRWFFLGKDWLFFCFSLSCIRFFSSATNCSRVKVAFSDSFPWGSWSTCSLTLCPCSWSQNLLLDCLYKTLPDHNYTISLIKHHKALNKK